MHSLLISLIALVTLTVDRCGSAVGNKVVVNDTGYTYKTPHPDGTGKVYLGREIAHVMSADGAQWLERSTRQQEEDADAAVASLPLTSKSAVADIGAGTGYYTFRISRRVPQGKVYAVEIQDEFVSSLQDRPGILKVAVDHLVSTLYAPPGASLADKPVHGIHQP